MRHRLLPGLAGVLVTALTLMLVSCGGGGGAAGPVSKIGTIDIGAMPAQALRDGGTFRWALDLLPVNFNDNQVDGAEFNNSRVISSVVPRLWLAQPDGTVKMNEDYLTSATLTSTNPEVVTYTLREQATWSDGTPITWQDFRAQWQALNGRNKAFQIASSTGYKDIASVERGTSDKQIVVTFATPFSDWQTIFDPLYPATTNTNPQVFNTGWTQGFPVTAGPFRVAQIDRTAKTITMVRNEKWWGRKPRLDRIIFRAIPQEAQFDALANNESDFVEIGTDVNTFTRAQSAPGVTVRKALAPNFSHITFNGRPGAILADQNLRIAIQKGINRQAITQALIGRIVPGTRPLGNHIYVQGEPGYQDNSQVVAYDPAEASRMLDALGWTRQGQGTRRKNGRELVIRDVIQAQYPSNDQTARQVQQFLAEIGVKVDITPVPQSDFFEKYITPADFDIAQFSWFTVPFPVTTSSSIYGTRGDVQQNFGGISNDTINNLFARASQEFDPTRKIELANQIDREIWKTGHSLLLYQRPDVWGVRNGIANIGAFGISDPIYANIGFTR
ncbi:MAG: ABC transporter family substrate-binding protein [Pseudonocardiales bacterium]|nr:ABC transporter family substrate-binding protein [Pseudonocardiales bacterium]MBV9728741.1 ABC transporter family substrate-binding protein [Pseudonocardiales bacterium]